MQKLPDYSRIIMDILEDSRIFDLLQFETILKNPEFFQTIAEDFRFF